MTKVDVYRGVSRVFLGQTPSSIFFENQYGQESKEVMTSPLPANARLIVKPEWHLIDPVQFFTKIETRKFMEPCKI